jgi:hypothetical protein
LVHSLRRIPTFAGIQRSILLSALNLYELFAYYAILFLCAECNSVNDERRAAAG